MTTAREFITLALKEATVLGVGQTALAEDINDGMTYLSRMIAQWQARRWMVPALVRVSMIGDNSASNTVGPDGYIQVQRPVDIKGGYVIQLNTGQTPVSLPLKKIFSFEDYIRIAVKDLSSLPTHFFYDADWPKGNLYIWPKCSSQYQANFLVERQLAFTGLSAGTITGGAGYIAATYLNVPLTGSDTGSGATANITVLAGAVTDVTIIEPGRNYVIGNTLSASNANLGGVGAGFVYTVTVLDSNLDYEFELPEVYDEAIHFNLAARFISAWQVKDPSPTTGVLAKVSLNTIKKVNTQIPQLVMPSALRKSRGFNLWNPDGY